MNDIVKNLLKDGGFYSKHSKERDQYLSEKAEQRVDEAISLMMMGHPGLLIRGLKCDKDAFSNLKFLDDIAPNCKGDCAEKHQNE